MSAATKLYLDKLDLIRMLRSHVAAGADNEELRALLESSDALLETLTDAEQAAMRLETWRGWPDLHRSTMSRFDIRAVDRLKEALEIARTKGEHYPVCNMPPAEVRNADRATLRAWREAHQGQCDCWKADMEAALK